MALPTVSDLKSALRVETTAEDALFTLYLARAKALVEGLVGKPIVAVERNVIVVPQPHPITGLYRLMLPNPLAADDVTLVDDEGDTVAEANYTADGDSGFLTFVEDAAIAGYYTATITHGWDQHSAYATLYEPLLSQAITDTVADWYQRRNPGATSESEASASVSYSDRLGLPKRVIADLDPMLRKGVR